MISGTVARYACAAVGSMVLWKLVQKQWSGDFGEMLPDPRPDMHKVPACRNPIEPGSQFCRYGQFCRYSHTRWSDPVDDRDIDLVLDGMKGRKDYIAGTSREDAYCQRFTSGADCETVHW